MSQAANMELQIKAISDRLPISDGQTRCVRRLWEEALPSLTGKDAAKGDSGDVSSDLSIKAINKAKLLETMITVLSKVGNGTFDLEHPQTLAERALSRLLKPFGFERISKNGGHIEVDRGQERTLTLGKVPLTIGKHISFDLDAKDPNHVKIRNVEGVTAQLPVLGKRPLKEIAIDRDSNGRVMITATIEVGGKLMKLPSIPLSVGGVLASIGR